MGATAQHIIQRQTFLFDSTARLSMFALQERISVFCRQHLSGLLDEVFSRHISEHVIIRLDKLEIDAGTVSVQNLEAGLTKAILIQVERKLTRLIENDLGYQHDENAAIEKYTKEERFFQLLSFFLQHGSMPAWANTGAFENLKEWLITIKPGMLRKEVMHLIEENARTADRLIDHFDDKVLAVVLYQDGEEIPLDELAQVMAISKKITGLSLSRIRNRYWASVVHAGVKGHATLYEHLSFFYELLQPGIPPGDELPVTSNRHSFFKSLLLEIERESLPIPAERKEKIITILRLIITESPNVGTRYNDVIEPPEMKESPALQPENTQASPAATPEQNGVYNTPVKGPAEDNNTLVKPSGTTESAALQPGTMQEYKPPAAPEQNTAHNASNKDFAEDGNVLIEPSEQNAIDDIPIKDSPEDAGLKKSDDNTEHTVKDLPGSADNDLIERVGSESLPGLLPEKSGKSYMPADHNSGLRTGKHYLKNPFQKQQGGKLPGEKTIYVHHAGIVLLHPFLITIFEEMKLIRERNWVNEDAQKRAVQILSYLSCGKDFCPEYEMPLLKFLCGLSLEEFVSPEIEITTLEKDLTTELLEAVIQHWPALGTISPDGLRETFLQREGKLMPVNEGWRLLVERKTIDILISKLPWGISLIKPPWMINFLYVDWI